MKKNSFFKAMAPVLYVFLPLLIFIVVYDLGATGLQYLTLYIAGIKGETAVAFMLEHEGNFRAAFVLGGLLLAFLCLLRPALQDGFLKPQKESWKQPWWKYALLLLGSAALSYGLNYIFSMTGLTQSSQSFQQVAQNQYSVHLVIGLILYGFVSPFVEEVVFRGFLYGRMKVYIPYVAAIFISSFLFGLYHGNIVQGLYGFIMGLIMALLYEYFHNFYIAFFVHAVANLVAFFIQQYGFI